MLANAARTANEISSRFEPGNRLSLYAEGVAHHSPGISLGLYNEGVSHHITAQRLSWQETAAAFQTTWDQVSRAVKHAVSWGVVHRELAAIRAIGVDEIQWRRGHKYLTLVYQIDAGVKRL